MSWWNPRDWYRNLFEQEAGAAFLRRNGAELRWPRTAFLLSVSTARDLHAGWDAPIAAAMSVFEVAMGRKPAFLGPVDAIGDLEAIWSDPLRRRGLTRSIHVVGGDVTVYHGHCDIDSDDRDGTIRSVLVTLPRLPPSWAYEMALHELGHALGLGHDPSGSSIMAERLRPGTGQRLSNAEARLLRAAYGP